MVRMKMFSKPITIVCKQKNKHSQVKALCNMWQNISYNGCVCDYILYSFNAAVLYHITRSFAKVEIHNSQIASVMWDPEDDLAI